MLKKTTLILLVGLAVVSLTGTATARLVAVPDVGSSSQLLGIALLGLAGLRAIIRK